MSFSRLIANVLNCCCSQRNYTILRYPSLPHTCHFFDASFHLTTPLPQSSKPSIATNPTPMHAPTPARLSVHAMPEIGAITTSSAYQVFLNRVLQHLVTKRCHFTHQSYVQQNLRRSSVAHSITAGQCNLQPLVVVIFTSLTRAHSIFRPLLALLCRSVPPPKARKRHRMSTSHTEVTCPS